MKILAILRAKEFSPNSVEKDKAIMQAVVRRLRSKGYVAELVNEEELITMQDVPPDTTVLSMGRMSKTLQWLSVQDARVINSPKSVIQCQSRKNLSRLPQPKVLVSNFYGNLQTVLHEFKLSGLFLDVIESSVVGLRKPDPQIFALGVKALGLLSCEVAVIGDSISKDMLPACQAGCQTIWYCGEQWEEEEIPDGMADRAIKDLIDLTRI